MLQKRSFLLRKPFAHPYHGNVYALVDKFLCTSNTAFH